MSGILTPGERQDPWSVVGDHHRRIRALEAVRPDGGLQFNDGTYGPENVGDWLDVETNATSPNTYGIRFRDTADLGGILLQKVGGLGNVYVSNDGIGTATLNATFGEAAVTSGSSSARVEASTDVLVSADTGTLFFTALAGATSSRIQLRVSDGNYVSFLNNTPIEQFRVTMQPTSGAHPVIQVANNSGSLIFTVNENGDVHMKAGANIIYDL